MSSGVKNKTKAAPAGAAPGMDQEKHNAGDTRDPKERGGQFSIYRGGGEEGETPGSMKKVKTAYTCKGAGYLDLEYAWWQVWLLWPVIALLVIPASLLASLFLSAFFVECYRHWHGLRAAYEQSIWDGARYTVCVCWKVHGRIWHGYEVSGLENLPSGPAIIVFYHGAIPIDHYYLLSEVLTSSGRLIKTVGDRFLYRIPGWKQLMSVFCVIPGGQANCLAALQRGDLLAISPGGVREAFFGQGYRLVWKDRVGFAKVAVEARVPIVPMFTMNVRESYRSFVVGRRFWTWLYERTRLPLVPIYGGFPVKMRTYLGRPIHHEEGTTPEQLALKVQVEINRLIEEHQKLPGNILRGVLERIIEWPKSKAS
ncbi:transmembrane protein 68-like isoform X3 [Amphibalanus amphitrite]|uniref:transmembrane protein 68-like isoform X3 n=1 Tax=Amphibalanus amphitrite TaxID=1232801 RepID=UPI001C9234A9|nr:transmembrane protein 68-like isoform X3 [Amphibalanus amphitrite]